MNIELGSFHIGLKMVASLGVMALRGVALLCASWLQTTAEN